MSFNESSFKKLGFRNKNGLKGIITASAEIDTNEYITIDIDVSNSELVVAGVEVEGRKANEIRKLYLKKYSLEEIHRLFTDY
tara:strand:+ start:45 stop:290 length:246 start_codon:yes stop_codon:yes gene_type:complete